MCASVSKTNKSGTMSTTGTDGKENTKKIVDGGSNFCLQLEVAVLPDFEKCTSSPQSSCEKNNEELKDKELKYV